MAKNKKAPKEEIIPEGMKKSDYADAAFRKKVTTIFLCILGVFIVGLVAVIVAGWYNTKLENDRYNQIQEAYAAERDLIKTRLEKIEADGGSHDDKSQVKINVTDEIMPGEQKWGLGVRVITGEGYPSLDVGSYGWSGAYGTHFWVDPENKVTAVFMKNSRFDGGAGNKSAVRFEEAVYNSFL